MPCMWQKSYRLFFPYPPLSRPIELILRKDNYLRKKCYSVAESWEKTCQVEALFSSQSGRNLRTPHYISAHRSGGRSLRVRGIHAGFVVREISEWTLIRFIRYCEEVLGFDYNFIRHFVAPTLLRTSPKLRTTRNWQNQSVKKTREIISMAKHSQC